MKTEKEKKGKFNISISEINGTAAGGVLATTVIATPVMAQTAVTDITAMVTSLGTLATAVTTVVLGAMVVRLGIKFVNRMTVKG
jgi:hypothetical protein